MQHSMVNRTSQIQFKEIILSVVVFRFSHFMFSDKFERFEELCSAHQWNLSTFTCDRIFEEVVDHDYLLAIFTQFVDLMGD